MNTLSNRLYSIYLLGIPALLTITVALVYRELRNIRYELHSLRQLAGLQLMIQTRSKDEPKMDPNISGKVEPAENVPTAPLR